MSKQTSKSRPFKKIGRIISRGPKTAGLFIGMDGGLPKGIYEIREIMGETMIVRIGDPAMQDARFMGLKPSELCAELPLVAMTQAELDACDPKMLAKAVPFRF